MLISCHSLYVRIRTLTPGGYRRQKANSYQWAGFARASFSTSYDRIIEATDRIERFVEKNS